MAPRADRDAPVATAGDRRARTDVRAWEPVHVTLRTREHAAGLPVAAVEAALRGMRARPDFRVVHLAARSDGVHLIVEADGAPGLARGMRGVQVRLALAVHAATGRRGTVLERGYEARVLHTPAEVVAALQHVADGGACAAPETRLLRKFPAPRG